MVLDAWCMIGCMLVHFTGSTVANIFPSGSLTVRDRSLGLKLPCVVATRCAQTDLKQFSSQNSEANAAEVHRQG